MAYSEITAADLLNKGVEGLPDTPGLTAAQMQQKFDEIAKDVIVPKFNAVVQKLNDPSGADDTQVTDPTTETAGSLNDALGNIETENAANTLARHTHDNKATLDDIDATVKAAYDRLVTLLGTITGIQSVLSSSTAELPDAKAVADAIATVQTEVSLNTAARHTHVNKATLDDITALVKQGYDDLVTLLTGIAGIETTLTNSNDKIPRSDAVYTAVDNLSAIVAANTAARHTHANKATLDAIDSTTKSAYDGLVTLLTGITTVVNTVTDNTTYIPTCHAIVDYVSSLGGGDMLKSVYDTNNDGTVDAADYATTAGSATTATTATSATTADSATTAGYANSAGDSTKLGGLNSTAYALTGDVQKLFGDVATYQATSVALRNYAVGDFMIYNNYFYEVTQAIAQGGTITDGTNITQKTVGEVLTALASATPADMTGATSLLPGTHGLVPAPSAGDQDKVLKGDGTWGTADEATVRYDESTSYIQCKDSQGWFNWKYASRIPSGETITPINDVELLQECAGLPAIYHSVSALLADTVSTAAIIANSNAVDYLARCTSFASDFCEDQFAMSTIGNNNYAANKLLANSTWCPAICYSTYFESVLNVKVPKMTSATTPSGVVSASSYESGREPYKAFDDDTSTRFSSNTSAASWLQYAFTSPMKLKYVKLHASSAARRFYTGRISAWNPGGDSVVLKSYTQNPDIIFKDTFYENNVPYSIYRINQDAGLGDSFELLNAYFYGRVDV